MCFQIHRKSSKNKSIKTNENIYSEYTIPPTYIHLLYADIFYSPVPTSINDPREPQDLKNSDRFINN